MPEKEGQEACKERISKDTKKNKDFQISRARMSRKGINAQASLRREVEALSEPD